MLLGIVTTLSVLTCLAFTLPACALDGFGKIWVLPVSLLGAFLFFALCAFLLIWISCAFVKMDKPQEKESRYFRFLVQGLAHAALPITSTRMHTKGLKQTPKSGRFFLVCNHLNDMDPVVLLRHFPKSQLAFISKRENDKKFLVGPLMHKVLCQPINRENDKEALRTILKCVELLENNQVSIAAFPEGYIRGDNLLHPFRNGIFKIAQKTNVPIVVCTLQNTQHIFKNALRLKPTDVELHLVKVIAPEEYAGKNATEIGQMVYALMADDLGAENVWQETELEEKE